MKRKIIKGEIRNASGVVIGLLAAAGGMLLLMTLMAPSLWMEVRRNLSGRGDGKSGRVLELATASKEGNFYWVGTHLKNQLRESSRGYEARILETGGSRRNIELLESRSIDLALVQSALEGDLSSLRALANVGEQYMHVIVHRDSDIHEFRDLAGKRVNLGPIDSGFNALGSRVLDFYNLHPAPIRRNTSVPEMVQELTSGEIDALLVVVSLNTKFVEEIFSTGNYRLVPIRDNIAVSGYIPGTLAFSIPSGVYGPNRALPSSRVPALVIRMLLVARPDLEDTAVWSLLETVYSMDFVKHARLAGLTEVKGRQVEDMPLHPAAAAYYGRNDPMSADRFEIAAFFIAGILAFASLLQYLKGRRRSKVLEQQRGRIIPYFEELLESNQFLEETGDIERVTSSIRRMLDAQRRAEQEWLRGNLDTEHMENLYAVFNVRLRNAFDMIRNVEFQKLSAQQDAILEELVGLRAIESANQERLRQPADHWHDVIEQSETT